jgi:tetratricopeptide (TPR) repeat protein
MSQSDRYIQANRFRDEGNLQAAISEFEGDIQENPHLARSYLGLGEIYGGSGRWEKAKEVYSKAVLLESSPGTYFLLGEALYQCGNPLQAVEAFRMSIQANPHLIESHLALATLYGNTKNPFMKEIFLKNALLLEESNPLVMEELIALYTQNFRYEEAVSLSQKYLMDYPNSTSMKLTLIENLMKMNKFNSAFEYLTICLKEDPQMVGATENQNLDMIREKIKKLLIKKKKKLLNSLASLPDPKIALEMSILFLFYGDLRNSAKYLVYTKQLKERIQMVE